MTPNDTPIPSSIPPAEASDPVAGRCAVAPGSAGPLPGSMWLVIYECRYEVVRVAALGGGFFAPGQEPCWCMENAQWISEIKPEHLDPNFTPPNTPG